jgi:predicted adenine nucleotide alpha hydrolase (AANH) superfamily ATPase
MVRVRNFKNFSITCAASSVHNSTYSTNKEEDGKKKKVLLHSCCAPCSGAMIEEMAEQGHEMAIYFYNPNIHPRLEYNLRKEENKIFADKLGIQFIDEDYDVDIWYKKAKGMEFDPERGDRCTMCFDMRLDKTAQYAATHGFDTFTTTNATSRWKDVDQVNRSGIRASKMWGVDYWVYDWQTDRMTERKYEINAENTFYKQQYCGCSFSLRDSNQWRKEEGLEPIKIGTTFYHDPVEDSKEESREVVDAFFNEYDHRNQIRDIKREERRRNGKKNY